MAPRAPDGPPTPPPEARYRHFRVTYPSGTTIDSHWLIGLGGTVEQVRMEHLFAQVEPVEDSRVQAWGNEAGDAL